MISEADRAAVVALACQLPGQTGVPLSRWTGPELARELMAQGLASVPVSASPIVPFTDLIGQVMGRPECKSAPRVFVVVDNKPFSWKYTAADLKDLLHRITEHEKQDTMQQYGLALAA